jgi:hypothetical protein
MRRALLVLAASILLIYTGTPYIVRAYLHRAYPDVLVDQVSVNWGAGKIEFREVRVSRETMKAELDLVTVYMGGEVSVTGGLVILKEGTGSAATSESDRKISATHLSVVTRKDGYGVQLSDASFRSGTVCFEEALVYDDETFTVFAQNGCFATDKSWATITQARVSSLYAHMSIGTIHYANANLRFRTLQVNGDERGDLLVDGGGFVSWADGSVVAELEEITLVHPLLVDSAKYDHLTVSTADLEAFIIETGDAAMHVSPFEKEVSSWGQCNNWLDLLPQPVPKVVADLKGKFKGTFSLQLDLDPGHLDIDYGCRFDCSDPLTKSLRTKFTYSVYDSKGSLRPRVTGPGSAEWVSIHDMPPYVPEAFRIMEDGGFFQHRGISEAALVASLKANLEQGKTAKGGSTITMQLAKNLWLNRDKTLTRKAHEAFLTMALESCLDKQSIMELYVNVIEFGPDLYGIGPAAKHYFGKAVADLTPDEAFYLASILPAPKKALHPDRGGMNRPRRIMKSLAKSGLISDAWLVEPEVIQDDSADWE